MSPYDIFVNSDWKDKLFFYEFGALYMSYDNYFYGKKFYILLAPHQWCGAHIYQKQKTESVYLIPKNKYGPFSEIGFFQKFPFCNSKNDDVIKNKAPF